MAAENQIWYRFCHLCSIPVENNWVEISTSVIPEKTGHFNPSIYVLILVILDEILSCELRSCLSLPHVSLQLKSLVEGKNHLQHKWVQERKGAGGQTLERMKHLVHLCRWDKCEVNLAIGEAIEGLALLLNSLYGTNLRENLSWWKRYKRFSETFFLSFAAICAR